MSDSEELIKKIQQVIDSGSRIEHCICCPDNGTLATGKPCKWCRNTPDSKFNVVKLLTRGCKPLPAETVEYLRELAEGEEIDLDSPLVPEPIVTTESEETKRFKARLNADYTEDSSIVTTPESNERYRLSGVMSAGRKENGEVGLFLIDDEELTLSKTEQSNLANFLNAHDGQVVITADCMVWALPHIKEATQRAKEAAIRAQPPSEYCGYYANRYQAAKKHLEEFEAAMIKTKD